jgi:predicted dehydrogenase
MQRFSRRDFLATSGGLSALLASGILNDPADAAQAQQPEANANGGANERLNIAVIGVNGQGRGHVSGYANRHNCVVSHICDVDSAVIGPAMQSAARAQGFEPQYVQDLRRIMDNRDIHAVSIATPNHWHALAAIWAMQAGKDVYVEKPVSHNVSEGRRIVEAARRYNRICQTGTQIRSQRGSIEAIDYLKSGALGRIQVARGLCYKARNSIGRVSGEQPIPATIDYDIWCGPAPRNPLRRQRLHYDWHWTWDYGNGDLGNQGIHQMDVARWGLGSNELSRSCISVGGRFGYVDDGETANTQIALFDYGEAKLIFEVRGLRTDPYRDARVGNVFHCAEGVVVFTSYSAAVAMRPDGEVIRRFSGSGDHFGNFIQAVRSRRREDLKADILEGHLSSALCHLANVSYRLGRPTPFDRRNGIFNGDADANETLARTEEHLRSNMVPLDSTNLIVGRRLNLDVQAETFNGDADANRHLTREYRRGFEVPARIG